MNWIVGPQLIGFIILLAGLIQKRFPPKTINGLYGYRTASSMRNSQSWNEANRYSAQLMIKAGGITLASGLLITWMMTFFHFAETTQSIIQLVLVLVPTFGIAGGLIYFTEKYLKKVFGNHLES
ncbi:SdpI family protein [Mucilaginibacter robiniae]|uniref:SdpI family protein n=1 Tax=Mucilaginibacter robiniae TaxID=2728022 RepID=A0A7L5E1U6_9SPHI|nr:SdpI family protein [Mucilaginibacter robiniae]QJD96508.1 SdpI family protein [Mucilaginibacter robiniae]